MFGDVCACCLIFADGFPLLVGFWHLIEKAKGMLPIFGPANRGSELVGIYGLYGVKWEPYLNISLGIQSYSQMMIGVLNHLLSSYFRFHYHYQKVIGCPGYSRMSEIKHCCFPNFLFFYIFLYNYIILHWKE